VVREEWQGRDVRGALQKTRTNENHEEWKENKGNHTKERKGLSSPADRRRKKE
jgi:hypothetical protein